MDAAGRYATTLLDVWTVVWKEWKEHVFQRGGWRNLGMVGSVVVILSFGVLLPLQVGEAWVKSPGILIYWAWVPLYLVVNVIADSFAGERERKTLETLLSTSLSDQAILVGKVGAAVLYAYGSMLAILVLGIVTTNVANWGGEVILYPAGVVCYTLAYGLLVTTLVSLIGGLISVSVSTVRQAQQGLGFGVMVLLFAPLFGYRALPEHVRVWLVDTVMGTDPTYIAAAGIGLMLVLNLVVFAYAMGKFRRGKIDLN